MPGGDHIDAEGLQIVEKLAGLDLTVGGDETLRLEATLRDRPDREDRRRDGDEMASLRSRERDAPEPAVVALDLEHQTPGPRPEKTAHAGIV